MDRPWKWFTTEQITGEESRERKIGEEIILHRAPDQTGGSIMVFNKDKKVVTMIHFNKVGTRVVTQRKSSSCTNQITSLTT